MKIWSLINRELRAQARQSVTYWLRALGLIALLLGGAVFLQDELFEANLGGRLFGAMHFLCYLALWILMPLAAADCISRERREGTLGLLFLTPLRPRDIVIAKSIAHGLRAGTLIVAVLPAFTIPFLLGGVPWQQAAMSLVVNINVLCWGIGAAIAASAVSRTANRATGLAMIFTIGGAFVFPWTVGAILGMGSFTTWTSGYSQGAYDFFVGFAVVGTPRLDYATLLRVVSAGQLLNAFAMATALSLAMLVLAVLFAANRIRHSWRELPPTAQRQKIERVFFEPRFGRSFLKRWMRFKLERNPIGWLEQRRWSGRIVIWAWFAIIVSVYSLVLTDRNFFRSFGGIHEIIGWAFALSITATAAGSFRRERETGVLELLLVTPLQTRQIVGGRLLGIWGQFGPAAGLFLLLWAYLISLMNSQNLRSYDSEGITHIWFFTASYVVLPVFGLYFSLLCRHFLVAMGLALLIGMVLPGLVVVLGTFLWWSYSNGRSGLNLTENVIAMSWVFQMALAGVCLHRLKSRLDRRLFPLQQSLQ